MGAASSLCHCIGNLRSGEHVSATVMLLLTAQVCLTSQPERRPPPPTSHRLSLWLRPHSWGGCPCPELISGPSFL